MPPRARIPIFWQMLLAAAVAILIGAPIRVWTANALEKIRPGDPPGPPAREIRLSAALGECEAAQLVVYGGARGVMGLDAAAFSFRGERGEPLGARLSLSRVGFVPVTIPSSTEGAPGLWPDPLVPALDPIARERRAAFPVDVPPGFNQPVWAEVCVPARARPGVYQAHVRLWARGTKAVDVPLRLTVRSFEIPATSTLVTTFGFSGRSAARAHHGAVRDEEVERLTERYARAALMHRLSLHGMSMRPPTVRGERVDFSAWDRELEPFMDGTALTSGARFTAMQLLVPKHLDGRALEAYLRAARAHLARRGWLDRAFLYLADEPSPAEFGKLRERAALVHRAAPGLKVVVTSPRDPALEGAVDVWTPQLNCFLVVERPGEFCRSNVERAAYGSAPLWWYQACGSHGCKRGPFGNAALDSYFTRWPRYVIDAPMAAHRAMGWLAWRYRIDGELYYNTVEAYATADPWRGAFLHGGNGEGTLFYPGTPGMIGGTEDVPVESLRLKAIRDGLEDHAYFALLSRLGGREEADRAAAEVARTLRDWEARPAQILAARDRWAARIEALSAKAGPAAGEP